MDYLLLWPIGFVAFVGMIMMGWVAYVAGDKVPFGVWPFLLLGGLCAVVSVLCFWPWRAVNRKEQEHSATCEETKPDAQEAIRGLVGILLYADISLAMLGLLSLLFPKVDLPPHKPLFTLASLAFSARVVLFWVSLSKRSATFLCYVPMALLLGVLVFICGLWGFLLVWLMTSI